MSSKQNDRDSQDLLSLLLDSIQDYAIFMLDASGRIATWNEGAKRIKGYSSEEVIGKHFSIFYPPEAKVADHPNRVLEVARRDGHYQEEGWRVRKDGSAFLASITVTPVFEGGELIGFAKVIRDLSERLLAEQRLLEHEKLVARLQEREDLVATLTHDMKNPLMGANRLLELLQSNRLERTTLQHHECLELVKSSIEDTLALTKNLIDVFRSDTEESELYIENIDLKALVSQSVNAQKPIATMRATQINAQMPAEELIVPLDLDAIKRVLQNLLSNAVKFAPLNGRVDVRVINSDSNITIEIEDDGPGIDDKERHQLFKRFSQASLGTRHSGGSGLGLYTCKRLIEAHNGRIECVSDTNSGAIFRIELPLVVSPAPSVA